MALLPDGGLARPVRARPAAAPVGPHRNRGAAPPRSTFRSGRCHQCTRPPRRAEAPARLSGPGHVTQRPLRKPATRAKPTPRPQSGMALHTVDGARKYLTTGERDAFLRAAEQADRQVRTLCMTLAFAGCRLSEALALTVDRVDLVAGLLVLESLKKRRSGIYRAVPVPPA